MEGDAGAGWAVPAAAAVEPLLGPPPGPPPPPPRAPQSAQVQEQQLLQRQRLVRRVEQAAALRALLYQVRLYLYSGSQFSIEWHLRFAALAVLRVACLVTSLTMPATTWMQHR